MNAGMSNPSQPGMIGGLVGRPVANSTGPGTPMPTPATSSAVRPASLRMVDQIVHSRLSTSSGPSAISIGSVSSPITSAPRSVTARVAWVAPRSAASTTRECGSKANRVGGRPPDERASPAAADQTGGDQLVDPGGDGGAGQPGEVGQLRSGPSAAVAQELKKISQRQAKPAFRQ